MQSNSDSQRQKIPNDGYFEVNCLPTYKDRTFLQKIIPLQSNNRLCSKHPKSSWVSFCWAYHFRHSPKSTGEDWESISAIKDWYGDVLFTAPVVSRQVARPLLRTILEELQNDTRKFTFLCGHDSNINSVLASLDVEDYSLPQTIEKKTPIGCKLVIEKWVDAEGKTYVALNLVYQSTEQLRNMTLLDMDNPPMVYPIHLKGLKANADGLYPLSALVQRFQSLLAKRY